MHKSITVPVVFCTSCVSTADKCSSPTLQYRYGKFCSADCTARELEMLNILNRYLSKDEIISLLSEKNIPLPSIVVSWNWPR